MASVSSVAVLAAPTRSSVSAGSGADPRRHTRASSTAAVPTAAPTATTPITRVRRSRLRPRRSRIRATLLRGVDAGGVVLDHAPGAELRPAGAQGGADHRQPPLRDPVAVAVVEGRDHLVGDEPVELRGVAPVLRPMVVIDLSADRPAVRPVVGLGPPAVEHAELEPGVDRRLHAARPA